MHRPARILGILIALASFLTLAGSLPGIGVARQQRGIQNGPEFDQLTAANGSIHDSSLRAFKGSRSMRATYDGNGANGYARGLFRVHWRRGETIHYTASYFLPRGFHDAMQGQVALMRWDNWPRHESRGDNGGIVIYGSDKRARLVRGHYYGGQKSLGRSFRLPEGRWFTLSVRQRLSTKRPRSRVRLDGDTVMTSSRADLYGRSLDRIRYGIVAIGAGKQHHPLGLWLDEASKHATH